MITSRLFDLHCSFLKNYSYFSFDPQEVSVVQTANTSTIHISQSLYYRFQQQSNASFFVLTLGLVLMQTKGV